MPQIKIKKGLNIPLAGKAEKILSQGKTEGVLFAIKPTDFPSLTPKTSLKPGDKVKAGDTVFFSKYRPEIRFASPVSGTLKEINRGERRKILEFIIEPDGTQEFAKFETGNLADLSREKVKELMLESGVWPVIRQRPFDVIAKPESAPKSIFISAFDSSPLAPDYDFVLNDEAADFQKGIEALQKLTDGSVNLVTNAEYSPSKTFLNAQGVEKHTAKGPHPAGNVGVHIHHIDPINKGEEVWHINPQDVVIIGRLFSKGIYDARKTIAITGSEVNKPSYIKTLAGINIESLTENNVSEGNLRYISGNVLSGTQVEKTGFLGYYDHQITVIPEGNEYEFFGWALPGFNKFSKSRTFFSWLLPKKEYTMNANLHGGERPFTFSEEYEKVFPMDIYPVHLLKAIMIEDIDQMEQLGIYEVGEEDMALCEYVCTSKVEVQKTLRQGFDLMIRELG